MEPPSGDWRNYDITYTEPGAGDVRWEVTNIRHYPVGGNDWRHNLYVSTYDYTGWPNIPGQPDTASWHTPQADVPIICWWSGEDTPYPLPMGYVILNTWTEKPSNEPGCNFPLEINATYKVAVYTGKPGTSSIVSNIHIRHPDEGEDVTQGHFSFDVYFTEMGETVLTVTPTVGPTLTTTPTAMPIVTVTPVDVEQTLRETSWNHAYPANGVQFNPTAAFQAVARTRDYGAPVTNEFDVDGYRVQGFVLKILYARVGDWGNVREVDW